MFETPIATINSCAVRPHSPLRLAVLGATGSIGLQTLDLVAANPDKFEVTALSVNTKIEQAAGICQQFHPKFLVVCDLDAAKRAKDSALIPDDVELLAGSSALCDIVARDDVDMVVTATVGYSGLLPTLAAIKANKDIALANKETLVVAGDYIRSILRDSKSRIFPVDSEHSAITQCLRGEDLSSVRRLLITASGGPFRTFDKKRLATVKACDALRHPNWDMGAKITIDSATMMNKAFEIIEAHYLFGIAPERITAVVHPQSIVHSMVEFDDGAVKAQLGVPDMHLPIAYALGMNNRINGASRELTIDDLCQLTFEKPDIEKFPCLDFATLALERRGNTACVINAANEIAVGAFLTDTIRYDTIHDIIADTLARVEFISDPLPHDFIDTNAESRRLAENLVATKYHI